MDYNFGGVYQMPKGQGRPTKIDQRTTETKNINKPLPNLGNVTLTLLKKQKHIP